MHTRFRRILAWGAATLLLLILLSPLQAAPPSFPAAQAGSACPALPPPAGNVIDVSNVSSLINAVNTAASGDTIRLADGTYHFGSGDYLRIDVANVTLRSAGGNREAVVLDGNYAATELIQIVASNVTIADLTLREAYYHPIHVMSTSGADTLNTLIYNVHIIDPREQAIKINPYTQNNPAYFPDNGTIACSHIELTATGRPNVNTDPGLGGCYTGGIDAHQARDWVIRDNLIEGFWCDSGLSEHGIHLWRGCRDTVVERNRLNNNARGIGFGLAESGTARTYSDDPCPGAGGGYVDHYGGLIRNNFVFANEAALFASPDGFDCGICLWQACRARVLHNTVASSQAPFSAIEWRFDNTDIDLINNLVTHNLRDRGGTASLSGNLQNQPLALFTDGPGGDLHLAATATAAIDQVAAPADVPDDIDTDARPIGTASDIGADEYGIPAPADVTDLRVSSAVTNTATLTAALRWTAPTEALTTTLRYASAPITEGNWSGSTLLTNTLAGNAELYTATVPYSGGTVYFALKTEGVGGRSGLSNNAFWPYRITYLPFILKQE